jgi:hypothetical protein
MAPTDSVVNEWEELLAVMHPDWTPVRWHDRAVIEALKTPV